MSNERFTRKFISPVQSVMVDNETGKEYPNDFRAWDLLNEISSENKKLKE